MQGKPQAKLQRPKLDELPHTHSIEHLAGVTEKHQRKHGEN
jgi:hypothetical protein